MIRATQEGHIENIAYTEIPIANDRVIGVKVLNNSDIVDILLYVYMPFYNGDISQTGLNLDATDVLQSVIDEYAAVSPMYIIGDLNVRLLTEQSVGQSRIFIRCPAYREMRQMSRIFRKWYYYFCRCRLCYIFASQRNKNVP